MNVLGVDGCLIFATPELRPICNSLCPEIWSDLESELEIMEDKDAESLANITNDCDDFEDPNALLERAFEEIGTLLYGDLPSSSDTAFATANGNSRLRRQIK